MTERVEIGNAILYHGDCLEILPTLPKVDAVVTDPPYLLGSASTRSPNGRERSRLGEWTNARLFVIAWMQPCWSMISNNGSMWICGNWRGLPVHMMALDSIGAPLTSVVVWDKEWIGVGPMNGLRQRYELVFHSAKGEGVKSRSIPDIWPEKWASQRPSGHESEKPIGLMRRCVEAGGGETILDPFMGSGTTGVACANLGCKFIGIEIERKYFDIACERIAAAQAQHRLFA